MDNIFELFRDDNVTLESSKSIKKEDVEKSVKRYVKNYKNLSLLDTVKLIEDTNPYDNGYILREDYQYFIDARSNLKDDLIVKNNFGAKRVDKSKANDAEQMIQRHIMLSDKYVDVLGKLIINEIVMNYEKEKAKKIDFITYKEDSNTINLIELKKCSYIKNKNEGDSSNTKENFIKVALQISTYYSFFIHALENDKVKNEIKRLIDTLGNVNVDMDSVNVRRCILAPENLFMTDIDDDELKELKEHYDLYTIRRNLKYDDLREYAVNSNEELFEIVRDN